MPKGPEFAAFIRKWNENIPKAYKILNETGRLDVSPYGPDWVQVYALFDTIDEMEAPYPDFKKDFARYLRREQRDLYHATYPRGAAGLGAVGYTGQVVILGGTSLVGWSLYATAVTGGTGAPVTAPSAGFGITLVMVGGGLVVVDAVLAPLEGVASAREGARVVELQELYKYLKLWTNQTPVDNINDVLRAQEAGRNKPDVAEEMGLRQINTDNNVIVWFPMEDIGNW